ncbi:hypothetical protein ABB34_07345 [Stenotrophomonas daejeonensis]|uniref:Uncharacterized protein n=1 Tax=Stenotrophomonas daejeonensis TaxID=659018 RepID=A0A0R0DV32_9GAMM|nr:hypothetical protein [Stenotrophomonas daejeonensis]KRG86025.1 hypothetical protein ABB34_07345 [Stenotrophomonas daejeonensis]
MLGLKSLFPPADPWPLKFRYHDFGVRCYNTLRCQVIYNNYCFTRSFLYEPSGPPIRTDWKDSWSAGHGIGNEFASPVEADWISLDGTRHQARIDLAELFKDRLVRHNVSKDDIPEGWLAAWRVDPLGVDILMEVNDRTINVYMKALIATKEPQIPGNPRSTGRRDLILVWTHTY